MKFLLIGAGIGQVNLAKKIKERGHYLLVIAYNSIPEVTNIADKFIHQDLFLYDEVLTIARREQVEAVVSDQHDIMAPLVAYIAEHMKLPGNTYDVLLSYCNKNTFRTNCDKIGIPCPNHIRVKSVEDVNDLQELAFPLIVKPADSQSSVGVKKVHSILECKNAVEDALGYSKTHEAIIEEFFTGQELVVEGFIWKGNYYNIAFGDRKYFNLKDLFIPSQTLFPSTVSEFVKNQIVHYEQLMTGYIKPNFAIVHSEYLYNVESGEIRIVESGLRGGGVFISSHLIPLCSGIDINNMLLDAAEGKELEIEKITCSKTNLASAYVCFYLPEGRIIGIEGFDNIDNLEFVSKSFVKNLNVGEVSPVLTHKGQRLGPILLKDISRQTIEQDIIKLQQNLHISVEGKDGLIRDVCWQ